MRHFVGSASLLLVVGLLAGCGQKGPLVLPPPRPAVAAPAAVPAAAHPAPAHTAGAAPASGDG